MFALLMGCGTEDVVLVEQAECSSADDCVSPKVCNVSRGVCEYVRTEPSRPTNPGEKPDDDSDVGTLPEDNEADVGGSLGTDMQTDVDPGADAESDSGDEPEIEEEEEEEDPNFVMCEVSNHSCDPSRPVQGDFVCIPARGSNHMCVKRCAEVNQPSTCDNDSYCREHDVNGTIVLGCTVGGCVNDNDCAHVGTSGGRCVPQSNGVNVCVNDNPGGGEPGGGEPGGGGTLLEGEPCRGGAEDRCMEGARCFVTHNPTNTGYCSRKCNPWSSIHSCPGVGFCEPYSAAQGMCNDSVERPGYYFLPYAECQNVGKMCDDASKCLAFDGGSNYCVPYCRASHASADCSGVRQPGGLFGGGYATSCRTDVFTNNNQVGLCL